MIIEYLRININMNINIPKRSKNFDAPSVWLEFSPLSAQTGSINLGQGYPDWAPPAFLEKAASESIIGDKFSTYARSAGHMPLVDEISNSYSTQLNHKIDGPKEVLVTVGATQALFLSIMTFIGKGDDVIVIEPAFDIYFGVLSMAEANIKTVSLVPDPEGVHCSNDLLLDWNKLESTLTKNTKAIIINTPHNPTGKVFSITELEKLSKILEKFPDCLVISDEVYEHIIYDGLEHVSIASLPGMFNRTLSIFSAGKTFSVTGWKVGWIVGPKQFVKRVQICQQWVVFSVSTPHQQAISIALKESLLKYKEMDNYYSWLKADYIKKRDLLYTALKDLGLNPILPNGSFFILCNITNIKTDLSKIDLKILDLVKAGLISIDVNTYEALDYNFCRNLSLYSKVTAIPVSAFYTQENKQNGQKWVRFAFCKDNETLKSAIDNLVKFQS